MEKGRNPSLMEAAPCKAAQARAKRWLAIGRLRRGGAKGWLENVAKGMRVHDSGTTYLVDYRDHSLMVPNFMKTVFGHGAYTRYEAMLFNIELICNEFFPIKKVKIKTDKDSSDILPPQTLNTYKKD